ncbi:hypothetical protein [Parasphingorhabdus sp.]|uniref:hypothetical protein n=1 Tax=Parasphingorhabdus sp. TaxID=2709688 RepID=UPI0032986650
MAQRKKLNELLEQCRTAKPHDGDPLSLINSDFGLLYLFASELLNPCGIFEIF